MNKLQELLTSKILFCLHLSSNFIKADRENIRYVNIFFILFILIFRTVSFAQGILIECQFSNSEYTGVISLDTVGQGMIRFKSENESSNVSCPLFIHNIEDMRRGTSPMVNFVFYRGICESVPEDFNLDILTEHIVLYLSFWDAKYIEEGYFRWLKKHHHREVCSIDTINPLRLIQIIRRFKNGIWGRGFALTTRSLRLVI